MTARKIVITVLVFLTVFISAALPISASAATATQTEIGICTIDLNLRKEPSASSDALILMLRTSNVTVVDELSSGWDKVTYTDIQNGIRTYVGYACAADLETVTIDIPDGYQMQSLYVTSFSSRNSAQCNNATILANSCNGSTIASGEKWSIDHYAGYVTEAQGYKVASVDKWDPVKQEYVLGTGVGGGICQCSSTVYAAALQLQYVTIGRKQHPLPVTYTIYDKTGHGGLDATIGGLGGSDLTITNTASYSRTIFAGAIDNKFLYAIFCVKTNG